MQNPWASTTCKTPGQQRPLNITPGVLSASSFLMMYLGVNFIAGVRRFLRYTVHASLGAPHSLFRLFGNGLLAAFILPFGVTAAVPVLTHHNDNARTGANLSWRSGCRPGLGRSAPVSGDESGAIGREAESRLPCESRQYGRSQRFRFPAVSRRPGLVGRARWFLCLSASLHRLLAPIQI
jgi:hypothetical protein